MAVTFITNALGGTTTTTSFSITLPTTQAGDILILEFSHRGTGNGTIGGTSVTTGGLTWTLKHSQLFATSTFSGKTYWTRATGNHAGQTVTGSGLTNACAAVVTQYRGALASGDPLADATIVGEQNASGDETQAQITTATSGSWVVLAVANSPDVAVTSPACTSPGALVVRAERLSTGGTDASIAHCSAEKATAGATGAFTWAQTNGASGSWAYAIEPEPASSTIIEADGSSTGAATIIGRMAGVWNSAHASTGGATVLGTAATLLPGVGGSSAAATATTQSLILLPTVFSANGTSTVLADGENADTGGIVEADALSEGVADGSFVGFSLALAEFSASGVASTSVLASGFALSEFSAVGVAVVLGEGAYILSGTGQTQTEPDPDSGRISGVNINMSGSLFLR